MRKLQCLPSRSIRGITYLLLGVRPITAEIHIRQLKLLCSIIRSENVTIKNILLRQIHTKSDDSNSWFIHIINLLEHYDLPTIKTLLHKVPCKITWKREVKLAVDQLWNQKPISDCSQKSSLTFCETAILSIGNVHRIWTAVQNNIKDVRRGGIKAQLLTRSYILQCNRNKFNQYEVRATCPLCQLDDEDTLHFLIKCNALYAYRKQYMKELKVIISNTDESIWRILSNDFNLLANVILEPDILTRRNLLKCNDETISKIENCTRILCYALHCGRLHMTNSGMSKN